MNVGTYFTGAQAALINNAVEWGFQNPVSVAAVSLPPQTLAAISSYATVTRPFDRSLATDAFRLLSVATWRNAFQRDDVFDDAMGRLLERAGAENLRRSAEGLRWFGEIKVDFDALVDRVAARAAGSAARMAGADAGSLVAGWRGIEDEVDAAWSITSSFLNEVKTTVDRLVDEVARDYSLVSISPHHMDKVPIDADSFVAAAALYRRFRDEARRAGREVRFIVDPADARDDGRLYVLLFPITNDVKGFSDAERASLDIPHLAGKRAIFVGDIRFYPARKFRRDGDFGFDTIFIQDHHGWADEFAEALSEFGRDGIYLVNNQMLFEGENPDSYASGAFMADLLDTGDPWYRFARALSLVGDKYHPEFPRFMGGYDVSGLKGVADTLNLTGTYVRGWRPDGAVDEKDVARAAREMILKVVDVIADSSSHENLDREFVELTGGIFGDEFERWNKDVTGEVAESIRTFQASGDEDVVYEVRSPNQIALLVHKIAFEELNRTGAFGQRTLIHFQATPGGDVVALIARGTDNHEVDVSRVCIEGPCGIKWGGGHRDRAGLGTSNVREQLAEWWGEDRDPQRIIDFVLDGLRAMRMAVRDS